MSTAITAIHSQLLEILRCPESQQRLRIADPELLARLNASVSTGSIRTVSGAVVEQPLEGGLVREDGQVLYPIVEGIPHLLIDEGIALSHLGG